MCTARKKRFKCKLDQINIYTNQIEAKSTKIFALVEPTSYKTKATAPYDMQFSLRVKILFICCIFKLTFEIGYMIYYTPVDYVYFVWGEQALFSGLKPAATDSFDWQMNQLNYVIFTPAIFSSVFFG